MVDTSLTPATNGRLDLDLDATVDGWKSASQINGGAPVAIGIQTMRATGRIEGVNRDRVAGAAGRDRRPDRRVAPGHRDDRQDKTDIPPAARAQLRLCWSIRCRTC